MEYQQLFYNKNWLRLDLFEWFNIWIVVFILNLKGTFVHPFFFERLFHLLLVPNSIMSTYISLF